MNLRTPIYNGSGEIKVLKAIITAGAAAMP